VDEEDQVIFRRVTARLLCTSAGGLLLSADKFLPGIPGLLICVTEDWHTHPGPKALGDRSAYLLSGMPLLQLLKMMKGAQGQVCSPVKGKKRRVVTLPRTFHPMPAITIQPHHPAGSVTRLLTRQVSRVTPSHAPYSPVSYLWKSGPLNFTRGISRAENPTEKRYLKWFSFL
jgi:hypothetical protein